MMCPDAFIDRLANFDSITPCTTSWRRRPAGFWPERMPMPWSSGSPGYSVCRSYLGH